jgi:hypothetical protein
VIEPPTPEREKEIESLMWDGIYIKLMTIEEWRKLLTPMETSWFGWKHGIYQFPTRDLLDYMWIYLNTRGILPSECIEIGAGSGQIGRHLGIRMTDNKLQDDPTIQAYYRAVGQPILRYSPEVEKIDANSAVIKYQPRVVIGCWVTEFPQLMFGVKEPQMLKEIETYILVGNAITHGKKPILKGNDGVYYPWIVSRSLTPQANRIWIIKGGKW